MQHLFLQRHLLILTMVMINKVLYIRGEYMNKKKWKLSALGILTGALLAGTFLQAEALAKPEASFQDGFDSVSTQAWSKSDGWSNGSIFNCTWRASNVTLADGAMHLTLNKDAQKGSVPFAGGEYRTNDTYSYGLYQVSMRPAKNPGIVSSFFVYTGPSDNNPWDEVDIEFLGKDTTKVQFNYFTNGEGHHEYVYDLGYDASTTYHTFAFDWQPTYIAWLVDGVEVHRATTNIPSHAGKIMMNLWPGIGVDLWLDAYDGVMPLIASYDWMSYDPPQ